MLARLPFIVAAASAVFAQDQTIHVGGTGSGDVFIFNPNNVNATAGSVITFVYDGHIGNHSVSQSSFAAPCAQLQGGFDSGFVFVPQDASSGFASWNLTITNASQPIWFYCKQTVPGPHCNQGMVGGINVPPSGQFSFDNFVAAAHSFSFPQQTEGGLSGLGAAATAPPGPLGSNGISGAGNPTAAAAPSPAGEGSGSAPAATTSAGSSGGSGSSGGALQTSVSTLVLLGSMFITLA